MSHAWILVFIGGGVGSIFRFGMNNYFDGLKTDFPLATFMANFISCFILGMLIGWQLRDAISDNQKLLLMTGFCGGFSTFSTFSAETLKLMQEGHVGMALFYVAISIVVGLLFVYLGVKMQETML